MKTFTDYNIDPLALSFGQLKRMLPSTAGQKLPVPLSLEQNPPEILFRHENGDMAITVFTNGLYLYQRDRRRTVFAVDRCKQLIYRYQDDEVRIIPESKFSDGPCLIPLFLKGDERLNHNMEAYEEYQQAFSLSRDVDDWNESVHVKSVEENFFDTLEEFEKEAKMQNALEQLTERQRQILRMYFENGLNRRQIAAVLHLSPSSVRDHINAAMENLRKQF